MDQILHDGNIFKIKFFFNTEFLPLNFDEFGIELLVHLKRRNEQCSRVRLLTVL